MCKQTERVLRAVRVGRMVSQLLFFQNGPTTRFIVASSCCVSIYDDVLPPSSLYRTLKQAVIFPSSMTWRALLSSLCHRPWYMNSTPRRRLWKICGNFSPTPSNVIKSFFHCMRVRFARFVSIWSFGFYFEIASQMHPCSILKKFSIEKSL